MIMTGPRRAPDRRVGGKIVRSWRTAAPRTPYERSLQLLPNSGHQNLNWLSRIIASRTRMIAIGAGKVLASVFGDSSSSSSSSEAEVFSDDDDMDDVLNNHTMSQCVDLVEKKNQDTRSFISLGKNSELFEWKNGTKHVMEQLLRQETFSREEGDKLIDIIKTRVRDSLLTGDEENLRPHNVSHVAVTRDVASPDICNTAIIEAKKWHEEKKLESVSHAELDAGTHRLNAEITTNVNEAEIGTPVDLAKSYMRARPPWASPSVNHIQLNSSSPLGTQLPRENGHHSFANHTVSSSKLPRDSPATGSWNLLDEIRKVRSNATKEMLRTRSSLRINWSAVASDNVNSHTPLVADRLEAGFREKSANPMESAGIATPGTTVVQKAQVGLPDHVLSAPVTTEKEARNLEGALLVINGDEGLQNKSERSSLIGQKNEACEDANAVSHRCNGNASGVVSGTDNGSQPLSCVVAETCQDSRKINGRHAGMAVVLAEEESCKLLTEACIAGAFPSEYNHFLVGSQSSSSALHHHESLEDSNMESELVSKTDDTTCAEKQPRRKASKQHARKVKDRG